MRPRATELLGLYRALRHNEVIGGVLDNTVPHRGFAQGRHGGFAMTALTDPATGHEVDFHAFGAQYGIPSRVRVSIVFQSRKSISAELLHNVKVGQRAATWSQMLKSSDVNAGPRTPR